MADAKISALSAATALTGTEEFAVNQGAASKKVTGTQILALAGKAPMPSARWFAPEGYVTATGGVAAASGGTAAYLVPIRRAITISDLAFQISTLAAGGNYQIAIYASDPTTGWPTGAAIYSSASQTTASTGTITISSLSITLQPGLYWFMGMPDNTTVVCLGAIGGTASEITRAQIGSSTAAIAFGTLRCLYRTGTFGTWPTFTGVYATDGWVDTAGGNRAPYIVFKIT